MKKIILIFSLSLTVYANDSFLGVFTTDTYPVDNCKVIKAHNQLYINEAVGDYNQYPQAKKNYLSAISQTPLKNEMIEDAKRMGFNAIIGYKYYVEGGFGGFNGSKINGSIGIGSYRAGVMGNFVVVKCKKSTWF